MYRIHFFILDKRQGEITMRKNWLKLALGMTAVVSLVAGASLLNNNIIDANAEVVAQDIAELDICNGLTGNVGAENAFNFNTVQGVPVKVRSANYVEPEITYNDVVAEDIADMLISDLSIGNAGAETAFTFAKGDTVTAEENWVHTPGSGYWQWDTNKTQFNVNLLLQFAKWNGGWFGFIMSDAMTELRLYNDRIEIVANGEVKGTKSFANSIIEGLHTVNMTYQYRKANGVVSGTRFLVTIDGQIYAVESDWYSLGGGNTFKLMNKTGSSVYVETAKPKIVTYSKVEAKDIAKWYIIDNTKRNEGWDYRAGPDNAFSFYMPQQVAEGDHWIHDQSGYWSYDVISTTGHMLLNLDFTGWNNDGWFGLRLGSADLRVYKNKIALYDKDNEMQAIGEKSFGFTVPNGMHELEIKYQARFVNDINVGSCFTAIIDGQEFVLDTNYITSGGHACLLWNKTGKTVTVETTLDIEMEYSDDQSKDLAEWWIINNQLRNNGYEYNAGIENSFNFLFTEDVAEGQHIFHDKPDFWSYAVSYSTGGMEFVLSFDNWNEKWQWKDEQLITEDGYFAIQLGGTQVHIYVDHAELFSRSGSEYLVQDTIEYDRTYTGMNEVTILVRALMYEGKKIGTEARVIIGAETYILQSSFIPSATHSFLINNTGTTVQIHSQIKQKKSAQLESYLNSSEYYEREVDVAKKIVEKSAKTIKNASAIEVVNNTFNNACNQLNQLPNKTEVDEMILANANYMNKTKLELLTEKTALTQSSFTTAQWNRIEEIIANADVEFVWARNEKETDTIKQTALAQIQLMVEDAEKLQFYAKDIAQRLERVDANSELAIVMTSLLDKITVANFAGDVTEEYLLVVLLMDGNGESESSSDGELSNDNNFEKIEQEDSNNNTNDSMSSNNGCASSLAMQSCGALVTILALAFLMLKKDEKC